MKVKLAVPDNVKFSKLFDNEKFISEYENIELFKVSEPQCYKLLLQKAVDAALISPIGYSAGVKSADLRIIPAGALSTVGFSGLASVFFSRGAVNINSAAANFPDDFLIKISPVLLSEKYGIDVNLVKSKSNLTEMLENNDIAVVWQESKALEKGLDISDEWYDLYEMPLPLLVWSCWADNHPENIVEIIRNLSAPGLSDEEVINETSDSPVDFDLREGRLFWTWTDEVEKALEQTFQFLYFHQLIERIGAIKVLGRD